MTGNYTLADAADFWKQNLADTWSAIKDPQTWTDAAQKYGNALLLGSVAPGPAGRTFYHFTDQDFSTFGGKSRGAVYLAATPEQATEGGLSGMRQRLSSPDEVRGPMAAADVPGGRVLTVTVPDSLRIYGENLPDTMTRADMDAAIDAAEKITHPDPKVAAKAQDLALRLTNGRSQTDLDPQLLDRLWSKYPGYENMSPEDTAALSAARFRLGPFRHLADTEFENPVTQQALKALGYDGARVQDEGGLSLAVMNPAGLVIGQ